MEGNIRGFSRYQVSGGKYKALVMVVPFRGKNWISVRTQGKKRNYILHFGILGDV